MATVLKEVDAVVIGVGWTGSILARELTKAGLNVVGLERGARRSPREDFSLPSVRDELKYVNRHELFQDTQQGFLADPIYGGNRNMAAWKMIGFPGAHYDYRDWIDRHNQRVALPPVGINTHPNWSL